MRFSKISLWLFVGLTTPALCAADISHEPTDNPNETPVQARIRTIQQGHAQQRALFQNLRFAVAETRERTGFKHICVRARDGRYHKTLESREHHATSENILTFVYDGRYYYHSDEWFMAEQIDPNDRLVRVSLRGGPADVAREFGSDQVDLPMFHLLDDEQNRRLFTGMKDPSFSETEEGLWCLEGGKFYDPNQRYSLYFDPHKGYALSQYDSGYKTVRTEFTESSDGIWYPSRSDYRRGYVHRSDSRKAFVHLTLDFEDFAFDVAGDVFEADFPDEARVLDYTRTKNKDYTTTRWARWRTGHHDPDQMEGKFIAGTVVDPNGDPIPRVLIKARSSRGGRALTEADGSFLLELEGGGTHSLHFIHEGLLPLFARKVPAGKRNLKVVLDGGATIRGRLVRLNEGKRVPLPNTPVKLIPEMPMTSASQQFPLRKEAQSTITDSEGGFQFKPVRTVWGHLPSPSSTSLDYIPRAWRLETVPKTITVTFDVGARHKEVDIIVRPNPLEPLYLAGRPASVIKDLVMDPNFAPKPGRQRVLCFFDAEGGPDRGFIHSQSDKCIQSLGPKADQWQAHGIDTLGILANSLVWDTFSDWAKRVELGIPLTVLSEQREAVLSEWGITHLPWLVWIDAEGVVKAEGLTFDELERVFFRELSL